MANTLFALNIEQNYMAAVSIETLGQVTEIIECGTTSIGDSFADSLDELLHQFQTLPDKSIVSLGGDELGFHSLHFPFIGKKKINQVIALELEETTTQQLDKQLIDLVITESNKKESDVIVAMVAKDFLLDRLRALQAVGIDPESITVSGTYFGPSPKHISTDEQSLLSPQHHCHIHVIDDRAILTLTCGGKIYLVRHLFQQETENPDTSGMNWSSSFIRAVRQTLVGERTIDEKNCSFSMSGKISAEVIAQLAESFNIEIRHITTSQKPYLKLTPSVVASYREEEMGDALSLALSHAELRSQGFNFRRGSLAQRGTSWHKSWAIRFISATALLCCLGMLCLAWVNHNKMISTKKQLKEEIQQVFTSTLPGVTKIVNPVQQLQVRINQLKESTSGADQKKSHSMLQILAELSATIPADYSVTLKRVTVDENNIRIKGIAKDFNTVDNIQKDLRKSLSFTDVTISSANLNTEGNQVRFELKINIVQLP